MDDDDDSEEEAGDAMEVEEEDKSDDGETVIYFFAVGLAVFPAVTCCLRLSQYCLSLFHGSLSAHGSKSLVGFSIPATPMKRNITQNEQFRTTSR
jgi:hypothetical protein